MKKLLVIAGNVNQYYDWLRENKININDHYTMYVHCGENLRGMEGNPFIGVGTYADNPLYGSEALQNAVLLQNLFEIREYQVKGYIENQLPYPKPPIGIQPERIWKEKRLAELQDTIKRYLETGLCISVDWVVEYNKLNEEMNN